MNKQNDNSGALQKLKRCIKEKAPKSLYFFHGEETFLLHHYLTQLKKILVDELTESFNFHKLTAETFSVQEFGDAVENLPMMSENTMVVVDEIDIFKLPEDERQRMIEILSDIPEYCTVVFTYVTTPWKPDRRIVKLWEAVSNYGTIVEFGKQDQRDLIVWVTRHFAARKKQITPDLCNYLIDITGGTMTALSGEIAKICAYSGADQIHKSDIDAVTEPVMDAVVFQMTDMLSQGAYGPALIKLDQLFKMQEEPLLVLGAIGGHFRKLSVARTLLDKGKTAGDLASVCKLGDYAARKTMSSAAKFSSVFLAEAAELVLETDRAIKTSADTPERLMEALVIRLAQEARNG